MPTAKKSKRTTLKENVKSAKISVKGVSKKISAPKEPLTRKVDVAIKSKGVPAKSVRIQTAEGWKRGMLRKRKATKAAG